MSTPVLLFVTASSAAVIAVIATPLVAAFARRWGIVDVPDLEIASQTRNDHGKSSRIDHQRAVSGMGESRKWHSHPTPLLGGLAVYLAFTMTLGAIAWWTRAPFEGRIAPGELLAVFAAGAILLVGGFLDDRYRLQPSKQFLFPLAAVSLVVASGIGISRITNPLGGVLTLAPWASIAFVVLWLLGTTYTTKLLDGLDGLAAGITAIGALLIAAFSLTTQYYQPDVALIAVALAGAAAGFLAFNFHPARIFLGEGGSTLCGFLLGVLAIISGGKVATALLVLGIPAIDAVIVIMRRARARVPIARGDRTHLHYQLLSLGFSHRGVVLLLYVLAAGFGVTTLFLQSAGKFAALGVLILVTVVLSLASATRTRA